MIHTISPIFDSSMFNFNLIVFIWIGLALLIFVVLITFKIKAPYGRHVSNKWGGMIDNRWGWFWMELPAFATLPLFAVLGTNKISVLTWVLIGLWCLHYFNRTFIFPFKLKTKHKKIPLVIVFSALFFNGVNGFIIGYYLGFTDTSSHELYSINVGLGLLLFFGGMYINYSSDQRLISIRNTQEGYQIPRGWLFEKVSCPNHFGEIIEWIGFAIIAWSLPAFSFAIWTFCNLVPRALNHHQWYHDNFEDYPRKRKAIFPYCL